MTAVFVFGSNLAGRHGKGAALEAAQRWGAQRWFGKGRTGNAYAIPTKDSSLRTLPLEVIAVNVDGFLEYARARQHESFIVTAIGCGLAGYAPSDIAPMFAGAPENIFLSAKLVEGLSMMHEDIMKRMALAVGVEPTMLDEQWPPLSVLFEDDVPELAMDDRQFCPEPPEEWQDGIRLLVTGGRNFADRGFAFARLDEIHASALGPIREIIEGGANGGDALARAWSYQRLGKSSTKCPADWDDLTAPGAVVRERRDGKRYNVNAGFARNQSMLDDHKPDACLPLPGGNGTADMVERCKMAGVPLL